MIKLPKQWRHWAKKARLKIHGRSRYDVFYLKGADRQWRVNSYSEFECSCPLKYFDRWANSYGASISNIPKTEREFMDAVELLIEMSKDKR